MPIPIDPDLLVETQRCVARQASRLARQLFLSREDRLDLEAEILVAVLPSLVRYDPNRSRRAAFARMVARRAAVSVMRKRFSRRRVVATTWVALPTHLAAPDSTLDPDLVLDVETMAQNATAFEQILVRHLMTSSVTETSRAMGIPRSSLQRHLQRLRRHCEDHGLDLYL